MLCTSMIREAKIKTENSDPLKKIVDSFLIKEKVYQSEISILKEQIRYLQGQLFGRKSEKISSDDGQLSLFETPEQGFPNCGAT